jgi:hypothetical protein
VGLSQRGDAFVAYCFDEAVYIWGNHVRAQLEKARAEAKDGKQAKQKQELVFRRLIEGKSPYRELGSAIDAESRELPPVRPNPRRSFRDPATMITPGE